MSETKNRNRVSAEGMQMGENVVRLFEPAIAALAAQGEPDERCPSCAFRAGTVPNGCVQTQMDALKCIVEGVPFLCHQHDRKGMPCHGWFAAQVALREAEKRKGVPFPTTECPWPFSDPDEETA